MAAFLKNLVLTLTAATLLEHLLPSGSMGRTGRMVLGLALLYTALSSLGALRLPDVEAAAWVKPGMDYQQETYLNWVRQGWEAGHGA